MAAAARPQPTAAAPAPRRLLADASARLRGAGIADAERDAAWLLAAALGLDGPAGLLGRGAVAPEAADRFEAMLQRRLRREPVARILGRRGFWSLELAVTPDVLDPRPDTELLVEQVLDRVADRAAPLLAVDLGTGSGCLLLALLAELPAARGIGIDRSLAALRVARANAAAADLASRARFVQGDWGTALAAGCADILVSNPPYIATAQIARLMPEVREHDPALALDGGASGLDAYRRIVPDLPRLMRPGGITALEADGATIGAVRAGLVAAGARQVRTADDLAGRPRALIATW